MLYFLDTEFIESGPHNSIDLISLGIVRDDGIEYYAISNEFDESKANSWVKENVLNNLENIVRKSLIEIKLDLIKFIDLSLGKPQFWGYYADYDWVVFCQIFGSMIDLPKGYPMYCNDIKQLCKELGDPKLPKQESSEHNALNDAKWNKLAYNFLITKGL